MIRFIDLGKQIGLDSAEWSREFAFYDTIRDAFFQTNGNQCWDRWDDFEDDLSKSSAYINVDTPSLYTTDRFKKLCPEWVFNTHDNES